MFFQCLLILAVILSFTFVGPLRTAIWIVPGLFFPPLLSLSAAGWIAFYSSAALLSKHQDKAFDFRNWEKPKWSLLFFLTGAIAGSLLYPVPLWSFGMAALLPYAFIKIFALFRWPVSKVFVFPAWVRLVPLIGLIALFIVKGFLN